MSDRQFIELWGLETVFCSTVKMNLIILKSACNLFKIEQHDRVEKKWISSSSSKKPITTF